MIQSPAKDFDAMSLGKLQNVLFCSIYGHQVLIHNVNKDLF